METYTVTHLTNTSREPKWITVWEKQAQAEYPEDIIDRYEYAGVPRMTRYSDGTVECTWEHFEDDEYITVRHGLIVAIAVSDPTEEEGTTEPVAEEVKNFAFNDKQYRALSAEIVAPFRAEYDRLFVMKRDSWRQTDAWHARIDKQMFRLELDFTRANNVSLKHYDDSRHDGTVDLYYLVEIEEEVTHKCVDSEKTTHLQEEVTQEPAPAPYRVTQFPTDQPIGFMPYERYETREDADVAFLAPLPKGLTRELYRVADGTWNRLTARIC